MAGQDWADILRRAGIPEPPGRAEMIAEVKAERAKRLEGVPRREPKR
jgi:hypothetical protein